MNKLDEYKPIKVNKLWQVWKHALGSFSEQDGYEKKNDNAITYIRTFIVVTNLICAYLIMWNILKDL